MKRGSLLVVLPLSVLSACAAETPVAVDPTGTASSSTVLSSSPATAVSSAGQTGQDVAAELTSSGGYGTRVRLDNVMGQSDAVIDGSNLGEALQKAQLPSPPGGTIIFRATLSLAASDPSAQPYLTHSDVWVLREPTGPFSPGSGGYAPDGSPAVDPDGWKGVVSHWLYIVAPDGRAWGVEYIENPPKP